MPLPISVLKRLRQKDRDMGLRHTMLSSPAALFLGFLFFLGEMGELPVTFLADSSVRHMLFAVLTIVCEQPEAF